VTVLATAQVERSYGGLATPRVRIRRVRAYRPGTSGATRGLAMAVARLAPGLVAREVPRDLDVLHHAVTVPIPRVAAPTVVTLHDVQHHELPQHFSALERRYRAWAYDGSARRADVVVTGTHYAAEGIVRHLGVARERLAVIPYGIDHVRFRPGGDDAAALAGVLLPARFVLYPANAWPHKNHARLVRALARTRDRGLELVLTGQPYGRLEELRSLARQAGVASRVHHLGHVPGALLPALYRRCAGVVFPSLFEGFGTPPLEAMACGCPVAASGAGSLAEVVGDAALAFDPYDEHAIAGAIDALVGDEGLRARLVAAGLERAARFTWPAAADAHLAAYGRALAPA
jgi:glycosyltransferase involved in cell wall biosynthesis